MRDVFQGTQPFTRAVAGANQRQLPQVDETCERVDVLICQRLLSNHPTQFTPKTLPFNNCLTAFIVGALQQAGCPPCTMIDKHWVPEEWCPAKSSTQLLSRLASNMSLGILKANFNAS